MKIVIDARVLGWTGIGRYTSRLLRELGAADQENDYVVLIQSKDKDKWAAAANFKAEYVDIEPYSVSEQLKLPGIIRGLAPDLVHFPHFTAPLLYRGRYVVTVHDLTLVRFRNVRGSGVKRLLYAVKYLAMRMVLRSAVKRARAIFTDTGYVKNEIKKFYHIKDERITVTWLGVDESLAGPAPVDGLGVGRDFLLYVGNFYPYKNVGSTIEALKLLAAKQPELKLVVVGKQDYFREQLEARAAELGLAEKVVFTGFVSDGELVSLYRKAKLYVYPSLSEGFGLQGLEAMAQGCPVLAASSSCLPEVYGDAAVYFDPRNVKDQAEKIADLLANEALRGRLQAAGRERIKQFSWRRMAEQTLEVYKQV